MSTTDTVVSEERLREIWNGPPAPDASLPEILSIVRELLDRRTATPQSGGVVVKGLVWFNLPRHRSERATPKIGVQYEVTDFSPEWDKPVQLTIHEFDDTKTKVLFFLTMDEAKAAAEADFESRIRSTLADPIPEAPADEEVEGRTDLLERLEQSCALNEYGMVELHPDVITEIVAALRRSTETDKPGVREAALEEAAKVADMFAADHAKSADQFGIDRNRELHNAAKGAAQSVAFAIRAISASTLTEEQPVAAIDAIMEASAMTANSGSGQFWIKIAFPTLAKMQAAHNALVKALPRARTESPNV